MAANTLRGLQRIRSGLASFRNKVIECCAFGTMMYWGNTEAVLERIVEALSYPHPCPLPGRARGKKDPGAIPK
jgi:hypothetical protein